jgi:hypothetical protein
MRGRGNRKAPNPLSRNYESNGPDVKIRGNAQHVAEKYTTLARDAQASGDRVMAENYLQHAEHYNRIILAAQAQAPQFQREDSYDDGGSDDMDGYDNEPRMGRNQNGYAHSVIDGSGPQPDIEGTPAEVALGEDSLRPRVNGSAPAETSPAEAGEEGGQIRRPRRSPRGRRSPRPTDEGGKPDDGAGAVAEPVSGD